MKRKPVFSAGLLNSKNRQVVWPSMHHETPLVFSDPFIAAFIGYVVLHTHTHVFSDFMS